MQTLKEEIKQKIVNAGKNRFRESGYNATSMRDIAVDAGISTGNIYRYFLTKKHLLREILNEIEEEIAVFLKNVPSSYIDFEDMKLFNMLNDLIIKMASEHGEALEIMFKCSEEEQFLEFKEKVLKMFTEKLENLISSMNNGKFDVVLCESVAKSLFEGITYIVKKNNRDIELLKKNLNIYTNIMLKGLDKRVLGVIENV